MNIKSITPNIIPIEPKKRSESTKEVKTEASTDRDPNGRRDQDDDGPKRPLTEDELSEVLQNIKALPGVIANSLLVRLEIKAKIRVILIVDIQGKVVRRICEPDFWNFLDQDQERSTGQIYDKSMW